MTPLQLVRLSDLVKLTPGDPAITVALIDGPVALSHAYLADAAIREIPSSLPSTCTRTDSVACAHGTFVAGILAARRGAIVPGICPGCTFLLRPIFGEAGHANGPMPSARPETLAQAIVESVNAGARVVNLSSALIRGSHHGDRELVQALDYAAHRGAIVVAAAGNQGLVGSSVITHHSWVVPVTACDAGGKPLSEANLGSSIGRRGLSAPGENITSLAANGEIQTMSGTSAAAPFVTGAIALLWSEFTNATAAEIRMAISASRTVRRRSIAPPVLDAWAAYQALSSVQSGRRVA